MQQQQAQLAPMETATTTSMVCEPLGGGRGGRGGGGSVGGVYGGDTGVGDGGCRGGECGAC